MKIDGKRVLVTGASGFIGRNLIKELCRRDCEVYALMHHHNLGFKHKNLKIVQGDVVDYQPDFKADIVFHLAGLTNLQEMQLHPEQAFQVNVLGTLKIADWFKDKKIEKFVFMSSSAVYGEAVEQPVSEESELKPLSWYGLSKKLAEDVLQYYKENYGLPAEIVRAFNVYGLGMSEKSLIMRFVQSRIKKEKFIPGNLDVSRDFIYIDDLIEGLIKVAEHGKLSVYNLGTGVETPLKVLLREVQITLGGE